jgi:uroporphyrinogen-III synthase
MTARDSAGPPQPLRGRRIVVTRAAEQAPDLLAHLQSAGATAISLPTIAFAPPVDPGPLLEALRGAAAGSYDGYIFTSQNGVDAFFSAAAEQKIALPIPAAPTSAATAPWICAIGPATARRLAARGWPPTILPAEFVAESVVAALSARPLRGQRILLARAAVARDVIPEALVSRGAQVDVVAAYRTVFPAGAESRARELFPPPPAAGRPDAVLFTSSSTARHLAALLGDDYRRRLSGVLLAAIGPVTAATLQDLGLAAGLVAPEFTAAALAAALIAHYAALPPV